MKKNNIIDLTAYFAQEIDRTEEARSHETACKIVHGLRSAFDVAATATIALCVCACTLLFFTML